MVLGRDLVRFIGIHGRELGLSPDLAGRIRFLQPDHINIRLGAGAAAPAFFRVRAEALGSFVIVAIFASLA